MKCLYEFLLESRTLNTEYQKDKILNYFQSVLIQPLEKVDPIVKMWRNTPSPISSSSTWSREGSKSPDFSKDSKNPKVGNRVIVRSMVGKSKTGILRYVGHVEFAQGG